MAPKGTVVLAPKSSNTTLHHSSGQVKRGSSRKPASRPVPKKEYDVETNMTNSNIFQAKQGLQLLKKKMQRTGASR